MLGELRHKGTLKATMYGMILDVTTIRENLCCREAICSMKDQDSEYLYVASIISEDVTENKFYEPFTPQDYGYGLAFSVKMQRFQVAPKARTMPRCNKHSFNCSNAKLGHRPVSMQQDCCI